MNDYVLDSDTRVYTSRVRVKYEYRPFEYEYEYEYHQNRTRVRVRTRTCPALVSMVPGVIRCGELESAVRFPRTTTVARQPIRSDFTEMGFPGGNSTWGSRIRGPVPSDHNSR